LCWHSRADSGGKEWLGAGGAKQHLGLQYFSNIQPKRLTACEAVLAFIVSYVLLSFAGENGMYE